MIDLRSKAWSSEENYLRDVNIWVCTQHFNAYHLNGHKLTFWGRIWDSEILLLFLHWRDRGSLTLLAPVQPRLLHLLSATFLSYCQCKLTLCSRTLLKRRKTLSKLKKKNKVYQLCHPEFRGNVWNDAQNIVNIWNLGWNMSLSVNFILNTVQQLEIIIPVNWTTFLFHDSSFPINIWNFQRESSNSSTALRYSLTSLQLSIFIFYHQLTLFVTDEWNAIFFGIVIHFLFFVPPQSYWSSVQCPTIIAAPIKHSWTRKEQYSFQEDV